MIEELSEKLEVFVVDDGSTDTTLAIAKEYEKKWPQIFHAIHKENGGYGTTVNWSASHAVGKYFKIIDGDDWCDKEGLQKLIQLLEVCETDVVVSQAKRVYTDGSTEEIYPFCEKLDGNIIGIEAAASYADVAIWGYSFRTELVKENLSSLPEHSFYTDRIILADCLSAASEICYMGSTVYNYRIGLEEQSTSRKSILRHYQEAMAVDHICCHAYEKAKKENRQSLQYLKNRISGYYAYTIIMLLMLPHNRKNYHLLITFEKEIKELSDDIYEEAAVIMKRVSFIRRTGYGGYLLYPLLEKIKNAAKKTAGMSRRKILW